MYLGKKINWGILGTSYISEVMAKAIQTSEISQLVAIGSRSLTSAQKFAKLFAVPKLFDDYQSLLNDNEVDAVYIGLPNHMHKEWIIRAAQAGKHILCEKPLVLDAAEALKVIEIVDQTQVVCMEALMYRYHPFIHKLYELIQSGILGAIKLYNVMYTANIEQVANPTAGGAIRNLGCYPISLIRLLVGEESIEIIANGRLNKKNLSDNQANAILKFADDTMAVVSTADDLEMSWLFDVYGSDGILKVLTNPWLPEQESRCHIQFYGEKSEKEFIVNADKPLYTYQIEVMNEQITNRGSKSNQGLSLTDSLGNIVVLEAWRNQVRARNARVEEPLSLSSGEFPDYG